LLLAKHGADTQKIERGIAAFEPKAVPSVRSDLAETNFEAFLARQQERIFSTAIQDVQLEVLPPLLNHLLYYRIIWDISLLHRVALGCCAVVSLLHF